ncbi:contractile injection system tape measure protein [Xenorhabdus siamensis]|uniref:contractile injection system tape measure protein n=1 Tax=Xenorhabdus siamensis TaxID=3136254 RepID=UPI0030F45313
MKKNHKINFNSVIDKLSIALEIEKYHSDKVIEKCSNLFKLKLRHLINEEVETWSVQNNGFSLKKVILDLGKIIFEDFEQQFIWRLERELKNKTSELKQNIKKNINNEFSISEKIKSASNISSISKSNFITHDNLHSEQFILKSIDNYLNHGDWESSILWQQVKNIEFSSWLIKNINLQPQQWLPMLAKHCLQPAGLSRLMQLCQPDILAMLCQLFTETTTSEFINSQAQVITDKKVTSEKLSLAAEYYLQHQMKYPHATQQAITLQTKIKQTPTVNVTQNESNLLKQTHNKADIQADAISPLALRHRQTHHQPAATQQHYGLIKETVKQSAATLQNREQHRKSLKSVLSTQIPSVQPSNSIQKPSAKSVLPINNAGCMILWPLLPAFFRAFDLLEKNQFISLEAQREAVCLLDWLIWAEEEIPTWRLTLNKVLCGLPIRDNALWHTPKPEQQIAINQWLEKTIVQLPAWKKMGANDVRHLFLQRCGELSELNGMTNIHIKPEVYDALISEWPWPMNIASFSWLQHPITITWLSPSNTVN